MACHLTVVTMIFFFFLFLRYLKWTVKAKPKHELDFFDGQKDCRHFQDSQKRLQIFPVFLVKHLFHSRSHLCDMKVFFSYVRKWLTLYWRSLEVLQLKIFIKKIFFVPHLCETFRLMHHNLLHVSLW